MVPSLPVPTFSPTGGDMKLLVRGLKNTNAMKLLALVKFGPESDHVAAHANRNRSGGEFDARHVDAQHRADWRRERGSLIHVLIGTTTRGNELHPDGRRGNAGVGGDIA